MKKITSIFVLICAFAFSGNVFSHDIGVKKAPGIDLTINSFDVNAVVSDFNYEAFDVTNGISFTPYMISKTGKEKSINILKSFDEDVSHILILNISNYKDLKYNITYAISPDILCIETMEKQYPITPDTPLPKHYLLPSENETWYFGSGQRNC